MCAHHNESGYTSLSGKSFTSKEIYQSQILNAANVLVVGPLLMVGATIKTVPVHYRILLFIAGISLIMYSGNQYLKTTK